MTAPEPSAFSLQPSAFPLIVMGVAGCGKTTIAAAAAARLGRPFVEGDRFHPQANVTKMASGVPLVDDDRWPWLAALHDQLVRQPTTVLACSALKKVYRDKLARGLEPGPLWVLLDAGYTQLLKRMHERTGHFMPPTLLRSQFDTLERPQGPGVLRLDALAPADELVSRIVERIKTPPRRST